MVHFFVVVYNKKDDSHFCGQMAILVVERVRVRAGISSNSILGDKPLVRNGFELEPSHSARVVDSHVCVLVDYSCDDEYQEFVN